MKHRNTLLTLTTLLLAPLAALHAADIELIETLQLPECHSIGWVNSWVKDDPDVRSKGWDGVLDPKHRAVLLTCYAAGLRLREATHLRIPDIDGTRQQIHITAGKGSKERFVPASPRLLAELREYWKIKRPGNYLFPGKTADRPLSSATVQKACKLGIAQAGIRKVATPHTMRHSFATSMLEAGVDLLTISKLLGHTSFITTMIYLHVRRQHFDRSPSPIDWLPVRQCPKWAEENPVGPTLLPTQQQPTVTEATNACSEPTPTTEIAGETPTDKPEPPVRRTSGRTPRKKRRGQK